MEFYNKKGDLVDYNFPFKYYKNNNSDIVKVPYLESSKEEIKEFVLECIEQKHYIPKEKVSNVYDNLLDKKQTIIKNLYVLYRLYIPINHFKSRSYYNAAKNIEDINYPLTSAKQSRNIKGIGKSIGNKIEDIILNGKLTVFPDDISYEDFRNELERYNIIKLFEGVWGINTKTAIKLVNNGYKTLNELIKNENLTKTQRLGIKYYYDLKERIPKNQITLLKEDLENIFKDLYPLYSKFCICGSYRRGLQSSGDIDVMVSVENDVCENIMEEYVNSLFENGIIIDTLTIGPKKFQGICRTPDGKARRIDIACIKSEHWGTGILYFTGSAQFNKDMRGYAKSKGFKLNEDHIQNVETKKIYTFSTEEEVFEFLDLGYIHPNNRTYLFY